MHTCGYYRKSRASESDISEPSARLKFAFVLRRIVMFRKIGVSGVLLLALFVAPVRITAASCALSNAPSETACEMGCCANKCCCETSEKNTSPSAQPFAKAGSDQQNIAALPVAAPIAIFKQFAEESAVFPSAEWTAHSPAPLALICIRLI